jgi:hypothetical protein
LITVSNVIAPPAPCSVASVKVTFSPRRSTSLPASSLITIDTLISFFHAPSTCLKRSMCEGMRIDTSVRALSSLPRNDAKSR